VLESPNTWVTDFTTTHPAFKNWEQTEMTNTEGQTASAVQAECTGRPENGAPCDACSIALSRIYKTYEVYLNNLFAETFKTHSEAMFNKLHEANLALENPVTAA